MINIVHPFFGAALCACNTKAGTFRRPAALIFICALPMTNPAHALPVSTIATVPAGAELVQPATDITIPCLIPGLCPAEPSRDIRPFERRLGRPCGYRYRYTPSGTQRVRVCF